MNENGSSHQSATPLKRLQSAEHTGVRTFLRTIGPLIFGAGVLCTISGMVSFFSSLGGLGPPRFFWLCFVGMPLMFVGAIMSKLGYMGALARFVAGEAAPVATDTINYLAEETQGAMQTLARSAAQGVTEGIEAGRAKATDFCQNCGTSVKTGFKFCPHCGKPVFEPTSNQSQGKG